MPNKTIDYSKTVIYKIVCNNLEEKDIFMGHTTNFTKRKNSLKSNCNNVNSKAYNLGMNRFIRDNGGWDNWSMILIEKYPCWDRNEANARERHLYNEHYKQLLQME